MGTGDSERRPYVFPACETLSTKNLSATKVPAKYFIGGVDEFDGAIPTLAIPLTRRRERFFCPGTFFDILYLLKESLCIKIQRVDATIT